MHVLSWSFVSNNRRTFLAVFIVELALYLKGVSYSIHGISQGPVIERLSAIGALTYSLVSGINPKVRWLTLSAGTSLEVELSVL